MMEATLLIRLPESWIKSLTEEGFSTKILELVPDEKEGGRGLLLLSPPIKKSIEEIKKSLQDDPSVKDVEVAKIAQNLYLASVILKRCLLCRAVLGSEIFLREGKGVGMGLIEWDLLAVKEGSLLQLIQTLQGLGCEVKIKRVKSVESKESLTQKQMEILRYAYVRGYFDFPKRIKISDIAERFGMSVSTVSEILRRGQKKIIEEFFEKERGRY